VAQKNQNAKRNTRASRRAAEEKAAQEKAEQAAKERKQQTIIGAVVVAIIVVLVAIAGFAIYGAIHKNDVAKSTTEEQAYQQLQKVETKPSAADDKGGILISSEGYGKKASGAPTVAVYMDPLCPGCASVNRQLDPTLVKLMNAGQLNIDLHFLNFQNNKSSDNYSNRVFNGAIYIAEHDDDPDHLMSYLSNIYAEDFQPGELSNYEPVNNAKLEKQAVKAGVSEDVAAAAFSGKNEYLDWLTASNDYTILRPELFNSSGAFSSPTLTINGEYWDLKQLTLADTNMVDGFLKSIGLDADQVGVEGKMPSIGASGKPISVAS
jgi:protein-disulfide isomerase